MSDLIFNALLKVEIAAAEENRGGDGKSVNVGKFYDHKQNYIKTKP